jgi:hypothetical protein
LLCNRQMGSCDQLLCGCASQDGGAFFLGHFFCGWLWFPRTHTHTHTHCHPVHRTSFKARLVVTENNLGASFSVATTTCLYTLHGTLGFGKLVFFFFWCLIPRVSWPVDRVVEAARAHEEAVLCTRMRNFLLESPNHRCFLRDMMQSFIQEEEEELRAFSYGETTDGRRPFYYRRSSIRSTRLTLLALFGTPFV